MVMKLTTLYVSDLDGTLLNDQQKTSPYTNHIIEHYVADGMLFSYATARSYYSAKPATEGLNAKIPLILYNGTFIIDNATHEIILSHFFSEREVEELSSYFKQHHFFPIVYALRNNQEKFSYYTSLATAEELNFAATRHDERKNPLRECEKLYEGEVFYISCIGNKQVLEPFYHHFKNRFQCLFAQDIYTQDWWLEILPQNVSKANAVLQLKELLKCDKIVAFGDGINDLSMFEVADECYAVANACQELKEIATGVIGHHNDDAVARWIEENVRR